MFSTLSYRIFQPCLPVGRRKTLYRLFASSTRLSDNVVNNTIDDRALIPEIKNTIRLSKLLSHDSAVNLTLSRRQAERLIRDGQVTLAGKVVVIPQMLVAFDEIIAASSKNSPLIKLSGKPILFYPSSSMTTSNENQHETSNIRVWAVHKVKGEVVTEQDPHNRPSLLERLKSSGVGKTRKGKLHLKPIGRLDIPTEGLMLITNDGEFAREMELPSNKIHRVYRARVFGRLTSYKLDRIRKGRIEHDNVRYSPMKVAVEKLRRSARSTASNTWIKVTCIEGKNRQIRNVFKAVGLTVSRLIRIQYGDYHLNTIPPGLAIPIPYKSVIHQKAKGQLSELRKKKKTNNKVKTIPTASPVKWVSSVH